MLGPENRLSLPSQRVTTLNPEIRERLLDDKVIVITGATRGIGRALAVELARQGAIIIGPHRDPDKQKRANLVIEEVNKTGGFMEAPVVDITKPEERQKLSDYVKQKYKRVDVLIHNAAGGLEEGATVQSALEINVRAKLALTRLFSDIMPQNGKVLDITSYWSINYGLEEFVPEYKLVAATKHHAEKRLKQCVAQLGKQIFLGFICGYAVEGTTVVKLLRKKYPDKMCEIEEKVGGKLPTLEDMAKTALKMLTSDFEQGHMEFVGCPKKP